MPGKANAVPGNQDYELYFEHVSDLVKRRQSVTTTYPSVNDATLAAVAFVFRETDMASLAQQASARSLDLRRGRLQFIASTHHSIWHSAGLVVREAASTGGISGNRHKAANTGVRGIVLAGPWGDTAWSDEMPTLPDLAVFADAFGAWFVDLGYAGLERFLRIHWR